VDTILSKEILVNRTLCRMLGVLTFIVLTSLGAFVRLPLPFTPVPITLQTLFVLLSGAFLGSRLGVTAQLSYMLLGIAGIPLFTASGGGLFYLFGPTGGYLFGFVLASFLLGRLAGQSKNSFSTLGLFCLADLVILSCGTLWLKFIFGFSIGKAFLLGFLPFVPGDMLKACFGSALYTKLRVRSQEIFKI
jgi:biotin transport system substrate-specific component